MAAREGVLLLAEQEHSGATNVQAPASNRIRDFAVSKRSRGRSGCLNCRRRRKKCDEGKPACAKCTTRGESCEWDTRITFRLSGIDTHHPSMVHSRNLKTRNDCQIMNVTSDGKTGTSPHNCCEQQYEMSQDSPSSSNEQSMWDAPDRQSHLDAASLDKEQTSSPLLRENGLLSANSAPLTTSSPEKNSRTQASTDFHISEDELVDSRAVSSESSHHGSHNGRERNGVTFPISLPPIRLTRPTNEMVGFPSEFGAMSGFGCLNPLNNETSAKPQPLSITTSLHLEALDYLTNQSNHLDFFATSEPQTESLQCYSERNPDVINSHVSSGLAGAESPDLHSVHYSNATYQDLQTTLYHHMVETTRNTTSTRHATSPFVQETPPIVPITSPSSSNIDHLRTQTREPGLRLQPLKLVKLTQRRQVELWRNYLDEIAVWLDMFDDDRNFQFQIPLLAKSADHLHYSILALSARQMERKSPGKPYTESLGLYQEAIQLIVKGLHTLDTTVIASCLLLCVLEMMSSSPRAWCRHLDGCAMLLEAAGVNGVVGGVRQSLFWCFARMDVWGGFLEDTLTKIPTSRWFIPSGSMGEAVTHFKAGSGSHSYANYAVFLCASVVNVISNKSGSHVGQAEMEPVRNTTYAARWNALHDLLEDWYKNRTEDMQPIMTCPSGFDESREPFSIVLYGSAPASNGNLMYHAAALLMLQDKPNGIRLAKSSKSILWHARQICGIAVSNSHHGALINSLQPLWIAGKLMSHESEHRAILHLLAQIERDTGWATAWRAEDLQDYWGDAECSETH